ncbi:MAG: ABC transporter permease [Terriglobales bacterium]
MRPRRCYAWLLRLFPASFRHEYGAEMLAADAEQRLAPPRAAADALAGACAAHADILRQDVRQALRTFRRAPGFAITVIVVLALGIGGTTAAYSLVYHVLLGPLPYPQAQQLVQIEETQLGPGFGRDTNQLSPANYRDWRSVSTASLAAIGAWSGAPMDLTGSGEPQRLDGIVVTSSLLPLLGVAPAQGRFFTAAEDGPGGPNVVILSHALWQQLGAKPGIIGSRLTLSGAAWTVVGVMPRGYAFPGPWVQIYTPFQGANDRRDTDRSNTYLTTVGRLRPGVSIAAAQSELAAEAKHLAQVYPVDLKGITAYVSSLAWQTPPQRRVMLWALLGGAVCVLIIACLNLAGLVLARLLARGPEWSTRTALGAGWDRLLRQLLTETLLLTTAGGGAGIGLAALLLPLLGRFTPAQLPEPSTPHLSLPVLAAAAALTFAAALLFGVLPAARWARSLRLQAVRGAAAARHRRLRPTLIVAEIAACMLLVALCSLLGRALHDVATTPTGYNAAHVLTLRTDLPQPKYGRLADQQHYFQTVLAAIRALPGTQSAGFTSFAICLLTALLGALLPALRARRVDPATALRAQ